MGTVISLCDPLSVLYSPQGNTPWYSVAQAEKPDSHARGHVTRLFIKRIKCANLDETVETEAVR
jgi:hypothetical protein